MAANLNSDLACPGQEQTVEVLQLIDSSAPSSAFGLG